jgi:two-component system response regulator YesN
MEHGKGGKRMNNVIMVSDGTHPVLLSAVGVSFAVFQVTCEQFLNKQDYDCDLLITGEREAAFLSEHMGGRLASICERTVLVILSDDEKCGERFRKYSPQTVRIPQSEDEFVMAVTSILQDIKAKRAKENFERMVLKESERVKPIIREQFLRDYILGFGDTDEIFNIYCKTFDVPYTMQTRMIMFQPENELGFEDAFFLKNIIEGYIGDENILMSTTIKENILIVTSVTDKKQILSMLERLEKVFARYYDYSVTMIYSTPASLADGPETYEKLSAGLDYCFYAEMEHIICTDELAQDKRVSSIEPDYGSLERAVKNGDAEKTQVFINNFFLQLKNAKFSPAVAKTYCLELYVCIIRCCEMEKMEHYMKGIVEIQSLKALNEIHKYILEKATEIAESNKPKRSKVYSSLIGDTLELIDQNLGNENLSLRWLAGTVLYTNVDYLGKLFKKEIGENFSHYVMTKRMEMAKSLILNGTQDRIYEVAEKVGYGSNSQYFSQVFKKYTGVSPLEYKEYARMLNDRTA